MMLEKKSITEVHGIMTFLFVRLHKKIRPDKGWLRLKTQSLHSARATVEVPLL